MRTRHSGVTVTSYGASVRVNCISLLFEGHTPVPFLPNPNRWWLHHSRANRGPFGCLVGARESSVTTRPAKNDRSFTISGLASLNKKFVDVLSIFGSQRPTK